MNDPTVERFRQEYCESPVSKLLHSKALEFFEPDHLARGISDCSPFEYPDGSLEFSVASFPAGDELKQSYLRLIPRPADIPLTAGYGFRNLIVFPLRRYWITLRNDYYDLSREEGFAIGTVGAGGNYYPGEQKTNDLLFSVGLLHKPTKRVTAALAERLTNWLRSVREHGIDSEGPVWPVYPQIQVTRKRVDIHLDVSKTGPRTLVWLILEMLNFGHEVAAIDSALFNSDDEEAIRWAIEGSRRAAVRRGSKFTAEDEEKYLIERAGGPPGERVVIPLSIDGVPR
jgi:hypothetical protein